ncbi:MAG: thioredoxin domain-containing protein [Proteobacteria bacterium]|nr:thioredoxin domain-containing protein [Candidatus Enterousia scatequi]
MTWTILVLVIAIALFLFSGMLVKAEGKNVSAGKILLKKCIKLISILLVAGCVCRLYVPYYLTSVNPMILQEMANNMQEKQAAVKNKAIRKYVHAHGNEMIGDAPVLGNEKATKTIYVWTDFSCPYCRRVHGELERVLKNRDDVRVVVKNFSIHGDLSDAPARAVIAAKMQDGAKAAKLASELMTKEFYSQDDLKDQSKIGEKVKANVMKFAKDAGLDTAKLSDDMNGEVVNEELSNVRSLAQEFEITGTPFLIIGDKAFPGAIPYSQIVDALGK